jgi:hypothetical protein
MMRAAARTRESFLRILAIPGLLAAAFLVYAPSLDNGFALDDLPQLVQNYQVHSISGGLAAFSRPFVPGNLYRPLTELSFAVIVHYFGLQPFWHHLANLVLHGLCTVLVLFCFSRIAGFNAGVLAALLFGLLPIHVETVANVAGRSELLCAFFGLLATAAALKVHESATTGRRGLLGLLMGLAVLAAVLSKESGLVFMLLIPLALYFQAGRPVRCFSMSLVSVFAGAVLVYAVLRWIALGGNFFSVAGTNAVDNALLTVGARGRVLVAIALLGRYIALSFAPFTLSADYSFAHLLPTVASAGGWSSIALTMLFAAIAVGGIRSRHPAAFFAGWFFCAFVVTANVIFPIGTIFGERLAYVPSAGLVGLPALAVCKMRATVLRYAWIILLCAFYGYRSWAHIPVWRSNETLYEHQIAVSPHSVRTLINWGVVLRNRGEFNRAKHYLEEALKVQPEPPDADALYALATVAVAANDLESAEALLAKTLSHAPDHQSALDTLARIRLKDGELEQAEKLFARLAGVPGGSFRGGLGRLAVMINTGRTREAARLRDGLLLMSPADQELLALSRRLDEILGPEVAGHD